MMIRTVILALCTACHASASETLDSLRLKWESVNESLKDTRKGNYEKFIDPIFDSFFSDWTRQEMRNALPSLTRMDPRFATEVLSKLIQIAAAHKDYATLQLCLECMPVEHVGYQSLGFFLAAQKDPLIFNLLFAACETSILAKQEEITVSLTQQLRYCFRECRDENLSPKQVLLIARSKYAELQPSWFLVEDYLQVSMPFEQRQFDLQDYSNMFKKMKEGFRKEGVAWPEEMVKKATK